MTNESLARSYLRKASDRLDILDLLLRKEAYSDVVREAQEIVELALKGMLRAIGIEPPKLHDVGGLLLKLGLFMNAVAKRLRLKSRRGFSQVRATQAYLRSVEETEREKPRRARGSAAVVGVHEQSELHRGRLAAEIAHDLEDLAAISKALRKERELAFYGDLDFIPTDEYSLADAEKAKDGAEKVVRVARRDIDPTL